MSAAPDAGVSRETADRLAAFTSLVLKWTARINLVSTASLPDLQDRHIADSMQLVPLAGQDWRHWVDLGSGGGFPGIVVAIATQDEPRRVTLIESDQRKAAFLRTAIRELNLRSTDVLAERIEDTPPQNADVVSARALGTLDRLLPLVARHLAPGGRALLPKGRNAAAEIAAVRSGWRFDLVTHASLTDPEARILDLTQLAPI